MNRTRRTITSSTAAPSAAPQRPLSDYQKALAAVKAAAKTLGYTLGGQLKGGGRHDSCRKMQVTQNKQLVGVAWAAPSGYWSIVVNGVIVAQGDESVITPAHTVLATAIVANRHERALVAA